MKHFLTLILILLSACLAGQKADFSKVPSGMRNTAPLTVADSQALAGIEFPDAAAQQDFLDGGLERAATRLAAAMRRHGLLPEPARGALIVAPAAWAARP